jgi:cobalt-precorrin-5B (C1)-methyltransferase
MTRIRERFDITVLAENGLKRGRTTGSCAAAAVKAALYLLEKDEKHDQVCISLPDTRYFLDVEIEELKKIDKDTVTATVIKHAGDDPDCTDGAKLSATVKRNHTGMIVFVAGPGVGTVTQPGIRVAVGEPAINPVPRAMMVQAVLEVLAGAPNPGYDLIIGCENGEQIAKRTFNARLGIAGGVSILGTTGIVEPMSLAAYKASIEVYIRVALGSGSPKLAFLPGNVGINFAKKELELPTNRIVTIANFIGFSLECADTALKEQERELEELWVLGHPGKIAKLLDGIWDTHSRASGMAMPAVAKVAEEIGIDADAVEKIRKSKTVEGAIEALEATEKGDLVWQEVARRCAQLAQERVHHIRKVRVGLFGMSGKHLARTE